MDTNNLPRSIWHRITNSLHLRSLQVVIVLSFSLVTVLVTIFVGSSITNRYARAMAQDVEVSTRQIVGQVSVSLETYLNGLLEVSNLIKTDIDKNRILRQDQLVSLFDTIKGIRKDIVTIAVFGQDGQILASTPNLMLKNGSSISTQEWYSAVSESDDIHIIPPHVQNLFAGQHPWVVSLSRPVSFIVGTDVRDGILLVDMNFRGIDELCRQVSLGKRGYIYIMDGQGNLVYHPQQQMIYTGVKSENNMQVLQESDGVFFEQFGGARRLVDVHSLKLAPWRIVGISYMDDLVSSRQSIVNYTLIIIVAAVLLSISLSLFISAKISKPVKKLEKLMAAAEAQEFRVVATIEGEEEVRHLSRTFNAMIYRIRQLMDQIVVEQEQKRKSEIKALQAQINPHFLYNTLDSIVWMAENGRTDDVVRMTEALARLFRISISRGKEFVPLSDELDHARSYMTIQQIRYRDKFRFLVVDEPSLLSTEVPKLVLQPILENAIYHGIRNSVDAGLITLRVCKEHRRIRIDISDNGIGMKPEKLTGLLLTDTSGSKGSGVGLKNVHDRIQLHYGPAYGLDIISELDDGTTVTIWLPIPVEQEVDV